MQFQFTVIPFYSVIGSHLAHTESYVSQHLDGVDIARRVNSLHAGLHIFVDLDPAPLQFDLDFTHSFDIGQTSDGNQRLLSYYRFATFGPDIHLASLADNLRNLGRGHDL